jgi:hypothetical protein
MNRWGKVSPVRLEGAVLRSWKGASGYLTVYLCFDGKRTAINVHRVVAMAFHGTREGLDVNHIDGDKINNRPENLEWCTRSENMRHALATGLMAAVRAVIATPKEGGETLSFASSKDAAIALGGVGKWGNIKSALCGQIPSAYGYRWAYDSQA